MAIFAFAGCGTEDASTDTSADTTTDDHADDDHADDDHADNRLDTPITSRSGHFLHSQSRVYGIASSGIASQSASSPASIQRSTPDSTPVSMQYQHAPTDCRKPINGDNRIITYTPTSMNYHHSSTASPSNISPSSVRSGVESPVAQSPISVTNPTGAR